MDPVVAVNDQTPEIGSRASTFEERDLGDDFVGAALELGNEPGRVGFRHRTGSFTQLVDLLGVPRGVATPG